MRPGRSRLGLPERPAAQQVELLQAARHVEAKVAEATARQHTAARRALHQALLNQVGLDHLFQHVTLLRQRRRHRSEEHTSELQSLMRISYAVFCLKKKNIAR